MEINGVAFKDPTSGSTNASESSLVGTFDTFLVLLTTQLQNQDPLDPMKSEQFTQQLVQFANVEQSINTNKKLDRLVELQISSQLNSAVAYIGKTVEVVSDQLMLADGTAKISYGLDRNAAQTAITIIDQNGRVVRAIVGGTTAGRHEFEWDGRDSNGVTVPDGVFGFTVTSVDDEQETVDTVAASLGRVTGVEIVDDTLTLNIGELGVPFSSVFAVRDDEPQS